MPGTIWVSWVLQLVRRVSKGDSVSSSTWPLRWGWPLGVGELIEPAPQEHPLPNNCLWEGQVSPKKSIRNQAARMRRAVAARKEGNMGLVCPQLLRSLTESRSNCLLVTGGHALHSTAAGNLGGSPSCACVHLCVHTYIHVYMCTCVLVQKTFSSLSLSFFLGKMNSFPLSSLSPIKIYFSCLFLC